VRGKLFGFCSALSLLLCLAVCALWVRSCWRTDRICVAFPDQSDAILAMSLRGRIGAMRFGEGTGDEQRYLFQFGLPVETEFNMSRSGANYRRAMGAEVMWPSGRLRYCGIAFPTWWAAALAAVMPVLWTRRHLRCRHRHRTAVCTACGYDLRATPDRCPECGRSAS